MADAVDSSDSWPRTKKTHTNARGWQENSVKKAQTRPHLTSNVSRMTIAPQSRSPFQLDNGNRFENGDPHRLAVLTKGIRHRISEPVVGMEAPSSIWLHVTREALNGVRDEQGAPARRVARSLCVSPDGGGQSRPASIGIDAWSLAQPRAQAGSPSSTNPKRCART